LEISLDILKTDKSNKDESNVCDLSKYLIYLSDISLYALGITLYPTELRLFNKTYNNSPYPETKLYLELKVMFFNLVYNNCL
jgi:hypothetical protein